MFWWQEVGKLEVFIKSKRYLVPLEDFTKYLEKETVKCLVDEKFYTTLRKSVQFEAHKSMYDNVLHFMLCNMKYTVKVQVYDDGAVRLYQHDSWCSIWWDTPSCYTHPLNLYLLDRLIEFVKQYK